MAFNPVQYVQAAYKNSPWVVISIAFHVVLVAVISVIAVKTLTGDNKEKTISIGRKDTAPPPEVVLPPEVIDRKAIPKNEEAEIVSYEEETYTPTEVKDEDLHLKRGDPTAADNLPPGATGGTSIGVGANGHYGSKPSAYASRRLGSGGKGRGGPKGQGTEAAVLEGLRWLVRHQNPDGSWAADTLRQRCSVAAQCLPADAAYNSNFNEGLTGLALLCFLGAGYDNNSKQSLVDDAMGKRYSVGEVVKNGLKWLKDRQNPDGSFTHPRAFMYNEALAAMAMTEAYGMSQSRIWKEPAQKAINFLVAAQKLNPFSSGGVAAQGADASAAGGNNAAAMWGWRYASRDDIIARHDRGEIDQKTFDTEMRDADTSVTTWVIMALKSAELSGLSVPREAMSGGLAFVDYATIKSGMVGYMSPEDAGSPLGGPGDNFLYHTGVRSALGMLVRTFVKHDLNDPMLDLGAKLLLKDLPVVSKDKLSVDYYYWYYGSLALNQFDGPDSPRHTGKFWDPWNEAMKDTVLQLQDKNQERDVCSRGGWLIPDRWFHYGGPIYSTGINILTLEVYYRYGNAFTGHEKDTNKSSAAPAKKDTKAESKPAAAPTEPAEPPKSGGGKSSG